MQQTMKKKCNRRNSGSLVYIFCQNNLTKTVHVQQYVNIYLEFTGTAVISTTSGVSSAIGMKSSTPLPAKHGLMRNVQNLIKRIQDQQRIHVVLCIIKSPRFQQHCHHAYPTQI